MATVEELTPGETTVTMVRGDSADMVLTMTDVAGAAVDLTKAVDGTVSRKAVVRLAVKSDPDRQENADAVLLKASHSSEQVAFLTQSGATLGQCRVLLDKADTESADPAASYRWDVEVSRQDYLRAGAQAGTVALSAGSTAVVGSGTAFLTAKVGDVLQPVGGANMEPALITSITDDEHVTVDHEDWTPETTAFEVRRGQHRTVLRGPFVIQSGVVAS